MCNSMVNREHWWFISEKGQQCVLCTSFNLLEHVPHKGEY